MDPHIGRRPGPDEAASFRKRGELNSYVEAASVGRESDIAVSDFLENQPEGSWLIRQSPSRGDFWVYKFTQGKIKKYKVDTLNEGAWNRLFPENSRIHEIRRGLIGGKSSEEFSTEDQALEFCHQLEDNLKSPEIDARKLKHDAERLLNWFNNQEKKLWDIGNFFRYKKYIINGILKNNGLEPINLIGPQHEKGQEIQRDLEQLIENESSDWDQIREKSLELKRLWNEKGAFWSDEEANGKARSTLIQVHNYLESHKIEGLDFSDTGISKKEIVFEQLNSLARAREPARKNIYIAELKPNHVGITHLLNPSSRNSLTNPSFYLYTLKLESNQNLPEITNVHLTVLHDGKIQFKEGHTLKSYDTFAEFQSEYNVVRFPDHKNCEKAAQIKQLSHAWGLKGYAKINEDFLFKKEGRMWEESAETLFNANQDLEIPEEIGDNIFNQPEMKNSVANAMEQIKTLRKLFDGGNWSKAGQTIIEMIESGQPVTIPSGYPKHAVYYTYHNGVLTLTNKGLNHPNNESGTYYFHIDEDRLKYLLRNDRFTRMLLANTDQTGFLDFQPHEDLLNPKGFSGGLLSWLGDFTFLGLDKKAPQKVGNCSFANCIAAMHSLAVLQSIADTPLKEGETIIDRANELKVSYKAFTFEVRTRILEAAQEFFRDDPVFLNDFMIAFSKINSKIKSYEDDGKFGRVSDRAKILKICRHYSQRIHEIAERVPEATERIQFLEHHHEMYFPGLRLEETMKFLQGTRNKWLIRPSRTEGVYTVTYTDGEGIINNARLPSEAINTMQAFRERFPEESRVREEEICEMFPEMKQTIEFYQAIKTLSVGKTSGSEIRNLLKGEIPGTWIIRESRSIYGQFVLSTVDENHRIVTRRLSEDILRSHSLEEFYGKYPLENNYLRPSAERFFESALTPRMNEDEAKEILASCDPADRHPGTFIVGRSPSTEEKFISFYGHPATDDNILQLPISDIKSYEDAEIDTLENPPRMYFSKTHGCLMMTTEKEPPKPGAALETMARMNNPIEETLNVLKSLSVGKVENPAIGKALLDMQRPSWLVKESSSTKERVFTLVIQDREEKFKAYRLNQKMIDRYPGLLISLSKIKETLDLTDAGLCTQIERKHEEIVEKEEYFLLGL